MGSRKGSVRSCRSSFEMALDASPHDVDGGGRRPRQHSATDPTEHIHALTEDSQQAPRLQEETIVEVHVPNQPPTCSSEIPRKFKEELPHKFEELPHKFRELPCKFNVAQRLHCLARSARSMAEAPRSVAPLIGTSRRASVR